MKNFIQYSITGRLYHRDNSPFYYTHITARPGKWQQLKATKIPFVPEGAKGCNARRKEATDILNQRIKEAEKMFHDQQHPKMVEVIKLWMEHEIKLIGTRNGIRQSTFDGYEYFCNARMIPYFEETNLRVDQVTTQDVDRYLTTAELGWNGKKPLCANSLKKHLAVLNKIFAFAIFEGYTETNPCSQVKKITVNSESKGTAYNVEQAKTLFAVSQHDPLRVPIYLGIVFGLRREEVLGLRWDKDLDLDAGIMHIQNTVVRIGPQIIEEENTKTKASNRYFELTEGQINFFKSVRAEQEQNRRLFGSSFTENIHVCQRPDGRSFSPDYVTKHFALMLKQNGLPHIRFHDLRHTCCSLLYKNGVVDKTLQATMGHARLSTTMDTYTHLESKMSSTGKIDALLST